MKLVTADQMRALEQRADKSGNTFAMMMEKAGKAVADVMTAKLVGRGTRNNRILVLVGPGNNGGDGLVCARYLCEMGADVSIYAWKRAGGVDDLNFKRCIEHGIPITQSESDQDLSALQDLLARSDVLVDALLGTGVARPIEGRLKDVMGVVRATAEKRVKNEWRNLIPSPVIPVRPAPLVVAVDLPSGLNPDTGAQDPATLDADFTVTFAFPKIGQLLFPGTESVGELIVADIDIPAAWADDIQTEVATVDDVTARLPARPQNSHKGTYGNAMICAGSINYVGAAYLAGSAAARAGAGLVTLALAGAIQSMVASAAHETTFLPLPDDAGVLTPEAAGVLLRGSSDYDALLIGPGFGRNPKTIEFVQLTWRSTERPKHLVIDADALYALAQTPEWWKNLEDTPAILTPHPGEMATLCGLETSAVQSDRLSIARRFATLWHQVIVLKGAHTVVAGPDGRAMLIPFATPALATAGTGDVLAGTITALLAQKLDPFDAAVVGAYLHGLAGKIAEEEIGRAGAVAGDLLLRLPMAMRRLRDEA
ncbi:MAG: NAD(P)H-hydrate dehydratase [Acidobacteriota bacterium]